MERFIIRQRRESPHWQALWQQLSALSASIKGRHLCKGGIFDGKIETCQGQ